MKMVPVSSSNIAAIGYDETRRELAVEFKSGARYHYDGVPAEKHSGLMSADSHGQYFAAHIKPHHPSRKAGGATTGGLGDSGSAGLGSGSLASAAARWRETSE
jgi:hypothetical protein